MVASQVKESPLVMVGFWPSLQVTSLTLRAP
jgi:hypothetical protein